MLRKFPGVCYTAFNTKADKLNAIVKEKHWIRLSEGPNVTDLVF